MTHPHSSPQLFSLGRCKNRYDELRYNPVTVHVNNRRPDYKRLAPTDGGRTTCKRVGKPGAWQTKQVTDAVITAGAAAAGSVTALSNGHMLFNLAMPFRRDWLDPLHGGHSVDSMLIPARALSWGYTQLGLIKIRPSSNDFSIEVKVHVDTGHTGRWRNIFHLVGMTCAVLTVLPLPHSEPLPRDWARTCICN